MRKFIEKIKDWLIDVCKGIMYPYGDDSGWLYVDKDGNIVQDHEKDPLTNVYHIELNLEIDAENAYFSINEFKRIAERKLNKAFRSCYGCVTDYSVEALVEYTPYEDPEYGIYTKVCSVHKESEAISLISEDVAAEVVFPDTATAR